MSKILILCHSYCVTQPLHSQEKFQPNSKYSDISHLLSISKGKYLENDGIAYQIYFYHDIITSWPNLKFQILRIFNIKNCVLRYSGNLTILHCNFPWCLQYVLNSNFYYCEQYKYEIQKHLAFKA